MKYGKPALTIDQQVDQLIRRGMTVRDRDRAQHHLHHINYYRLRAYWLPDEVPAPSQGEHAFRPGTDFDDILTLYAFDRKLRLLVMDAIERVEVSLRTRWAHVLSLRYGAHGYLDATCFRKASLYVKCLEKLRDEYQRSNETFVLHYRKAYNEPDLPPFWGICELLSFGQLSLWFQNLADGADRVEIARPYGVDEQILKSFAHHLTYVRNVCAHHSRLWNREMTIGMKIPNKPEWLGAAFNAAQPKRLYNTLVMLAYLLRVISPGSAWRSRLYQLLAEHPNVDVTDMGFPESWHAEPLWMAPVESEEAGA
ncbi:MAG: Abi family protein [Algiphilus sp.]|uniref:Abi family protein n=1 Tax=Algiphilus sp. TaxID=1872431 RepID=UPI0025C37EB9|nr:Abi family protein [Algiphilus sp.]MCI5103893.1 Abi family protein [Algiphilus sp.]